MANNLHRLSTSLLEISRPKLGLGFYRFDPRIFSASIFGKSRFLSSSEQRQQQEFPKSAPSVEEISSTSSKNRRKAGQFQQSMRSRRRRRRRWHLRKGIGNYVNKETGEIGGPRGPEPTRYGDWERGGCCSDF